MIRLVIVDDELLARVGIQSFFDDQKDMKVCGSFPAAETAIAFLEKHPVDVILTDIEMTDMDGLAFAKLVKERHYARGVIIVSCHEDFAYARKSISVGVDSYLLKQEINKESLVREIRKISDKTVSTGESLLRDNKDTIDIKPGEICKLVVIRLLPRVGERKEQMWIQGDMLFRLIDGIVSTYRMGSFYIPVGKEPFLLFCFDIKKKEEERKALLISCLKKIEEAVRQYTNHDLLFGVSGFFSQTEAVGIQYEYAVKSFGMRFYDMGKRMFEYKPKQIDEVFEPFSVDRFFLEKGCEVFENELEVFFREAYQRAMSASLLKERLTRNIGIFFYRVKEQCDLDDVLWKKWNVDVWYTTIISQAENKVELETKLMKLIVSFRQKVIDFQNEDNISQVFNYIDRNPEKRMKLMDLAEISCTSIPTLCRKFKERSGKSVVQYVNEKKIGLVKKYLGKRKISLDCIAEYAGFSNANYMSRVFKQVQGQTIRQYMRALGKKDSHDDKILNF